jgi:hypothetical protein
MTRICRGTERIEIELVFENGTALIPPLIENQTEILKIFRTIPSEPMIEARKQNDLV